MLVTDGGQLIRTPVDGIRIAGRNTQGVTIFRTRDDENVVSVGRIEDVDGDEEDEDGAE
jgi:DNA gyrase subunit A